MHLDIHQHAVEDLRNLRTHDPKSAAAVMVALEQIQADPKAIDKLTTSGNNIVGTARLNIKPWENPRNKANLWRFRVLDTPATVYRIVYGYHWQTRQICIFAVVHKEKFD